MVDMQISLGMPQDHRCEQRMSKMQGGLRTEALACLLLLELDFWDAGRVSPASRTSRGLYSCCVNLRLVLLFLRQLPVILRVIFSAGAGLPKAVLRALEISWVAVCELSGC